MAIFHSYVSLPEGNLMAFTIIHLRKTGQCCWKSSRPVSAPIRPDRRSLTPRTRRRLQGAGWMVGWFQPVQNPQSWRDFRSTAGWWFGTCFIFHNIWDPFHWLIFFRGVETTNQTVFWDILSLLRYQKEVEWSKIQSHHHIILFLFLFLGNGFSMPSSPHLRLDTGPQGGARGHHCRALRRSYLEKGPGMGTLLGILLFFVIPHLLREGL